MTTRDIDLLRFSVIPNLDVPATVTLATEVLARVPTAPTQGVRKSARKLRQALDALRAGWQAKAPVPSTEQDRRSADVATDTAWSALQRRLAAFSQLPAEHYPDAKRAGELNGLLFADGLRFLTLPWKSQWAEGDKRLKQIDEGGLSADIERLAGAVFLAEVRRTHDEYGKALGIATPLPEAPTQPTLGEPLIEVRRALKRYALQVIASADEDDDASIAAVTRALGPIDEARPARAPGDKAGGDEEPTPT